MKNLSRVLVGIYLGIAVVTGFSIRSSPKQILLRRTTTTSATTAATTTSSTTTRLFSSPVSNVPANEFSRIFKTDKIASRGRSGSSARDYSLTVRATSEECQALAKRFELKDLTQLDADVAIRPVKLLSGNHAVVQVEGTISAHLTQVCVRTNEDFRVVVEFPINAVVRPVKNTFLIDSSSSFQDDQEDGNNNVAADLPPPKKKKKKQSRRNNNGSFNDIDMKDLEAQLSFNVLTDDDNSDADNMVEDESVYSLGSDNLDVGELVAQTFWLNLDPYPKKPGTGPVEISISG
jgi:uncharacterized metal-binding protein YceD (DUF177 family)